jgi:hypothetical protein
MIVKNASIFVKAAFRETGFLVGGRRDLGFNFFLNKIKEVLV